MSLAFEYAVSVFRWNWSQYVLILSCRHSNKNINGALLWNFFKNWHRWQRFSRSPFRLSTGIDVSVHYFQVGGRAQKHRFILFRPHRAYWIPMAAILDLWGIPESARMVSYWSHMNSLNMQTIAGQIWEDQPNQTKRNQSTVSDITDSLHICLLLSSHEYSDNMGLTYSSAFVSFSHHLNILISWGWHIP